MVGLSSHSLRNDRLLSFGALGLESVACLKRRSSERWQISLLTRGISLIIVSFCKPRRSHSGLTILVKLLVKVLPMFPLFLILITGTSVSQTPPVFGVQ